MIHTSLPVTVFVGLSDGWQNLSGLSGRYWKLCRPNRARMKEREENTFKCVVKQLTSFGATHTCRHDASPLTVHSVQAAHPRLPVTVSRSEKKVFGPQLMHAHTFSFFLAAQRTLDALFELVIGCRFSVDEVIRWCNHCVLMLM